MRFVSYLCISKLKVYELNNDTYIEMLVDTHIPVLKCCGTFSN